MSKDLTLVKGRRVGQFNERVMSELQVVQSALETAAGRCRWNRALRGLWYGLLAGALLSLLALGAYHLFPLPLWNVIAAALVPFPCMLLGLLIGGLRKPKLQQVARWLDGRQRLQERLSTALEVSSQPDNNSNTWRDLVLADAAQHVRGINPRQLLPFGLPKATRWALLVLALAAGLGFVPEYRSKSFRQKKIDETNIKEAGRQLAELTRHNLEKRTPIVEQRKESLEAVAALGDQLAAKSMTRSEALKDLANQAEKLKEEISELARDPALRRLEQAARSATGAEGQTASALQKQMEALQKQMGTPIGNPDALEKLKSQLDKLQQAAKGLADKNSPGNDAERQKLSDSLSALSRQAQDIGLQMPQLDDAINALAANQTDLLLKDLQAATTDLEKLREMSKNMQQLQQQVEKLGKDLAEQLKNGQPELAQQTLQKMISQLKAANLTPEQLQKMMDEVAKAVSPAANYGKVAEHLKAAAGQMKSGDKPGAAQSLAKASDELQNLMQQLADAQQIQAALDAMNQASSAIGTGQGWRMARGMPRAGKGGKPGSGVGTWADEDGQWDGTTTAGWDNSGVVRPDEDPRGVTDRGEGEVSDALKPTKVKGQFSPGGPMPSITLKGVSIKGQSTLGFEQAATAAQSDAESALSQEKVPRAYQGSVRDYFDDLKK